MKNKKIGLCLLTLLFSLIIQVTLVSCFSLPDIYDDEYSSDENYGQTSQKSSYKKTNKKEVTFLNIEESFFVDIDSINPINNEDFVLSPGETGILDIKVSKMFNKPLENVFMEVNSSSPYLTFEKLVSEGDKNTYFYGPMDGNAVRSSDFTNDLGDDPILIHLSEDTPLGTEIPVEITFSNTEGEYFTEYFTFTATVIYPEIEITKYFVSDSSSISKKNYSNGEVNPGETFTIDIGLFNIGEPLFMTCGTLKSDSEYVTIIEDEYTYGELDSNCYSSYYYKNEKNEPENFAQYDKGPFKVKVSENTPDGTVIPFEFIIDDAHRRTRTSYFFDIPVKSFDSGLVISDFMILDDDTTYFDNNSDGIINSGEKILIDFNIFNPNNSAIEDLYVEVSTDSEYVSVIKNSKGEEYNKVKIEKLDGKKYCNSTYTNYRDKLDYVDERKCPFRFDVSKDIPDGTKIKFAVKVNDKSGSEVSKEFVLEAKAHNIDFEILKYDLYDHHVYSNFNNYNLEVNPGEMVYMNFVLKNIGTNNLYDLRLKMNCDSEYVSKVSYSGEKSLYIGNKIKIDQEKVLPGSSNYPLYFTVSENTPIGTVLPFVFTFTDKANRTWEKTLEIPVKAVDGDMEIVNMDVYDHRTFCQNDNSDNIVNPGESVAVYFNVKNVGNSVFRGLKGKLISNSEYITIDKDKEGKLFDTYEYGFLDKNEDTASSEKQIKYKFHFTVAKNIPEGKYPVTIEFSNINGQVWNKTFEIDVVKRDVKLEILKWNFDEVSGIEANNYDDVFNPGEEFKSFLYIGNKGNVDASNVDCVLSSSSEYISITKDSKNYLQIPKGQNEPDDKMYGLYNFTISKDTPFGTKIPFTVTMTDSTGEVFVSEKEIKIEQRPSDFYIWEYTAEAPLHYYKGGRVYSYENNNDNNSVNPGETVEFYFSMGNKLGNGILLKQVHIEIDSKYATVYKNYEDRVYNQRIDDGKIFGLLNDFIYIKIADNVPHGAKVPVTINFEDEYGLKSSYTVTFDVVSKDDSMEVVDYFVIDTDKVKKTGINNGDGKVNPGETIDMNFLVYNKGADEKVLAFKLESLSDNVLMAQEVYGYEEPSYGGKYTSCNFKNYDDLDYAYEKLAEYNDPINPEYNFDISPFRSQYYTEIYDIPTVIIPDDIPVGTKLPFKLTIIDRYTGNFIEYYFELEVE